MNMVRPIEEDNALKCVSCPHREECFFGLLDDKSYKKIYNAKQEVHFRAGETIFKQGTSTKYIIFLLNGLAKVCLDLPKQKRFILRIVRPFEFIDFPTLFENDMMMHSGIAVEDSEACLIAIDVFKELLQTNSDNTPRLLRYINRLNRETTGRINSVIYKNMEGRIADALLYLVNKVYFSRSIHLTISRTDIAELSGLSKESTSRILSNMKEQNIIKLQGRNLEILDKKYLEYLSKIG